MRRFFAFGLVLILGAWVGYSLCADNEVNNSADKKTAEPLTIQLLLPPAEGQAQQGEPYLQVLVKNTGTVPLRLFSLIFQSKLSTTRLIRHNSYRLGGDQAKYSIFINEHRTAKCRYHMDPRRFEIDFDDGSKPLRLRPLILAPQASVYFQLDAAELIEKDDIAIKAKITSHALKYDGEKKEDIDVETEWHPLDAKKQG